MLAVVVVSIAALLAGASVTSICLAFGTGFWSLINFTMQMAFVAIGGYVVATSRPAAFLIERLAAYPRDGRTAVGLVAFISLSTGLINWGLSLIFSGLLVLALARHKALTLDYRAAGAAAYLGLGTVWALGLSSSAAQLQANAASLPKALLPITGVIPFSETIFLWQSLTIAGIVSLTGIAIAVASTPRAAQAVTADDLGIDVSHRELESSGVRVPAEWLEHSPLLTLLIVGLGAGWLIHEFADKPVLVAVSSLNT